MTKERCRSRSETKYKKIVRFQPEEEAFTLDLASLEEGDILWARDTIDSAFFVVKLVNKNNPGRAPYVGTLFKFDPITGTRSKHEWIALQGAYSDFYKGNDVLSEDCQVMFVSLTGGDAPQMGYIQEFTLSKNPNNSRV